MRPSVIPSLARNLNLPLKSEMSRCRFAPLDMTFLWLLRIDFVINFAYRPICSDEVTLLKQRGPLAGG